MKRRLSEHTYLQSLGNFRFSWAPGRNCGGDTQARPWVSGHWVWDPPMKESALLLHAKIPAQLPASAPKASWLEGRLKRGPGINCLESYQNVFSFYRHRIAAGHWLPRNYISQCSLPPGTKFSSLDTEQKRHMSLKTPPCSFWIPALVSSSNALGHEAGFLNDHVE